MAAAAATARFSRCPAGCLLLHATGLLSLSDDPHACSCPPARCRLLPPAAHLAARLLARPPGYPLPPDAGRLPLPDCPLPPGAYPVVSCCLLPARLPMPDCPRLPTCPIRLPTCPAAHCLPGCPAAWHLLPLWYACPHRMLLP